MTPEQLARRTRATEQHDHALDRWPDRAGNAFTQELRAVIDQLEALCKDADASCADPIERSRTYRFLGDAYFDLARGTDATLLSKGVVAYEQAEVLLEGGDNELEKAKLHFNFANTIRGLSGGQDRALLEEAELRYSMALATFRREAPQFVAQVQATSDTLKPQLQLAALHGELADGLGQLAGIQSLLQRPGAGPDAQREASRLLSRFKARRRGTAQIGTEAADIARAAAVGAGGSPGAALERQIQALQQASSAAASRPSGAAGQLLPLVLARFQEEIAAGRITPDRQRALTPLLQELQQVMESPDDSISEGMSRVGRLRELMQRLQPLVARPSMGGTPAPEGTRAALLEARLGDIAKFVTGETLRPNLGSGERDIAKDLLLRIAQARQPVRALAADDARCSSLEREVLRPLALDAARFALRHHLTLATPFWTAPLEPPDPNFVVLCGGQRVRGLLAPACRTRELQLAEDTAGAEPGQARWDALWKSHVAVFDLSVPAGPPLAAVCYELGLAKALGRKCVVVVPAGATLPFDIDVEPYVLEGSPGDAATLAHALDAALYAGPARQPDSSVGETASYVARAYSEHRAFEVRHSAALVAEAGEDAEEGRRRIEALLGFLGPEAPRVLQPAWPGDYPQAGAKRLFHVMPFGLEWSTPVRDIADRACQAQQAEYVRGDEVADSSIIRSIWNEICRASYVLVDLTGFNANVALELGIAHALGRPCLVAGQDGAVGKLFPAVRKLRVVPYSLADKGEALQGKIEGFLRTLPGR